MTADEARVAVLERDDGAFELRMRGMAGEPTALGWQVGHFAVLRTPQSMRIEQLDGSSVAVLPWIVVHIATAAVMLDFATERAAWRFADEISIVCGGRIDHEPDSIKAFCQAVPDVVKWVTALDAAQLVNGERCVVPFAARAGAVAIHHDRA